MSVQIRGHSGVADDFHGIPLWRDVAVTDDRRLSVEVGNDPASVALMAQTATLTSAAPLTVTPAAGQALRLWWISAIGDPDNSSTGTVTVTLPTGQGDDVKYLASAIGHRDGGGTTIIKKITNIIFDD